jgi:hypothetical protein
MYPAFFDKLTSVILPKPKPTEPGFYWLAEKGEPPFIVEVNVEPDSHGMFFVLLPGEDYKYPPDLWPHASWIGPVAPLSVLSINAGTA